jgi:hypothetical protein
MYVVDIMMLEDQSEKPKGTPIDLDGSTRFKSDRKKKTLISNSQVEAFRFTPFKAVVESKYLFSK